MTKDKKDLGKTKCCDAYMKEVMTIGDGNMWISHACVKCNRIIPMEEIK